MSATDCLVVIYTKVPTLLGKQFVLEHNPTWVGRGADNHIVLDDEAVSLKHARFEYRERSWFVVDNGSASGTYRSDEHISCKVGLMHGARVTIGRTIFKLLSGADVEAQYDNEIFRLTIMDGLTQLYNKPYFCEALEREILRARRYKRDLGILLFDIDHFKRINEVHGELAGDFVLKELARLVQARLPRNELVARYGGDELAIILWEMSFEEVAAVGETLRQKISEHLFVFGADSIRVTISVGAARLQDNDPGADDLIKRADEHLHASKETGCERVIADVTAGDRVSVR